MPCCLNHQVSDNSLLFGFRYVANETPGTKQAKLQLLEQLGWKCYSVTWAERYDTLHQNFAMPKLLLCIPISSSLPHTSINNNK